MQQSRVIPSPRSFRLRPGHPMRPTLAGLKPASLFRYQPAPGQDAAAMAAAWHAALSPRGSRCGCLGSARAPGPCWSMYTARPVWPGCWQRRTCWTFWRGGLHPGTADELLDQLAERLCCEEISRMRSAFFWDTRWRMSSGSSKTAAKTLPRAAIGRSTPIPPLRRQSLTAIKVRAHLRPLLLQRHPDQAADGGRLTMHHKNYKRSSYL